MRVKFKDSNNSVEELLEIERATCKYPCQQVISRSILLYRSKSNIIQNNFYRITISNIAEWWQKICWNMLVENWLANKCVKGCKITMVTLKINYVYDLRNEYYLYVCTCMPTILYFV